MVSRFVSALFLLFFLGTAHAAELEQAQFAKVTETFSDMFNRGQYEGAIDYGERSVKLGISLFGPNAPEVITLMNNLATCHLLANHRLAAIETAAQALAKVEASGGGSDIRAARTLLVLGRAYGESDPPRSQEALLRALRIQEAAYGKKDPRLSGVLRELGNNAVISRSPLQGRRYYERAVAVTENAPPEYADARGMALFELGRYEMSLRNNRAAEKRFLEVLDARANQPPNDSFVLSARSFLIELYDRLDEPDAATAHVQYLASLAPEADDVEMKPLFKLVPNYPPDALAAGKEGDVRLEATIDATGRVIGPRVVSASSPKSFEKACLDSVRRWRYKPRVVDGRYVARENMPLRCVFEIRRR